MNNSLYENMQVPEAARLRVCVCSSFQQNCPTGRRNSHNTGDKQGILNI